MPAAAFFLMLRCRTVSVSGFRRIGRRLPNAPRRRLASAALLTHFSPCLNGSGHWRTGLGSQNLDREPELLALLAWEERLARWQRFPKESRAAFVTQLSRLMTRVASAEMEDERSWEDHGPPP